ncbi:hypothetical protein SAMN05216469_10424 [Ruminococcus albus]|uniref:Uncharacterized protein n=1 Tax=Ruminococcus albus TaxID=1264 RepID=A0A1H7IQY3_RUMAL|nr:hypothetical protein SAMN05216469_10424 [Ruminococcus albus]
MTVLFSITLIVHKKYENREVDEASIGMFGNKGSIKLNGIRVYNVNSASDYALKVSDYAPLLVNKASKFANLNVSRVSVNNTGTSSNPAQIGIQNGGYIRFV